MRLGKSITITITMFAAFFIFLFVTFGVAPGNNRLNKWNAKRKLCVPERIQKRRNESLIDKRTTVGTYSNTPLVCDGPDFKPYLYHKYTLN
jgi:hypothetical protein